MSKKVTRLYKQFAPDNYNIIIKLGEDKRSFTGSVEIFGKKTDRPNQRITLHQKELRISNVKLVKKDKTSDQNIDVSRVVLQNSYDELRIHTEDKIYPGEYKISMDFAGSITKNMDGIYPCFFNEDDKQKELIATQFESHHAREAFPCIDEPEAKATFSLSLTHNKDEIAIGNTPVVNENVKGTTKTTSFEQTPIMSTYLLAFVVGEMDYREAVSKNGIKIRTYATRNQVKHTEYALDIAVKCMDFYEDYYDIPFPLEKCDFVALPDFASGAMENWGLITFREQTLLNDIDNTSLGMKQYVAIVIAHELTHQWFGNLVTMQWWTDLWLNEGFASWMEYLAIDELFPKWQVWTQFAVDDLQLALKIDSLEHTHPIEVEVKHPDEIRTIFDAISYQKGASVIHMLQHYLGPEGFREGLRHYLRKHSYKNTITVDLWQALEDVTNKPVKEFMNAWTSKSGFPIVEVEKNNDHLKITQSRFVTNPVSKSRKDDTLWPVPLLSSELAKPIASKKINNIPIVSNEIPLKINEGQSGFYRVNYSHELQQVQLKALDNNEFGPLDRMGLLADSFEVTKAGYQPVTEFLELLEHYRNEDSLSVWEIIAGSVGSIRSVLSKTDEDNELRNLMKPFVEKLASIQVKRLGWEEKENENHLDTLLRPIIIGMTVGADSNEALEKALLLYKLKITKKQHINPDLRGIVYSTAARKGGQKEFEEMLDIYKKSDSSDEKLALTAAICSFRQSELHQEVFNLIKSDVIRTQDNSYWIAYSFMNRHARNASWEWMKENWEWMKETMGTDLSFSRMPVYAARTFAEQSLIDDYVEFFTPRMEPLIERTYNQGLEMAQTATAWRLRDSDKTYQWFNKTTS
jgi:puromycin-sensitive aminopeptidase